MMLRTSVQGRLRPQTHSGGARSIGTGVLVVALISRRSTMPRRSS